MFVILLIIEGLVIDRDLEYISKGMVIIYRLREKGAKTGALIWTGVRKNLENIAYIKLNLGNALTL